MNDTNLFFEEEQTVQAAEGLIVSIPSGDTSWSSHYQELLSRYRKLLSHAKRLVNVGDLMQNDLNAKNEQLRIAQEREEQLRAQLLYSQKMEAIGTLTGGIAHDFNNLLTIVNGYTEIMLADTTEDDPIYADLQKVLETGRKGTELVQRLLAYSRRAEMSPEPLDLRGIVENSVSLMRSTFPKMIEIETILEDDLCMIKADPSQIDQVLMNLCMNAKESMPKGGRVRIESRNTFIDEEYCRLHLGAKVGQHVLVEISDTGCGMSKELTDRIFDPFFTTKGWDFKKGTGLGLSVAAGIVEQHGGWIECQSELDKGTTFRIYFPAIASAPMAEETAPEAETAPGSEKILLIEDEAYVLDLGKRILERAGYSVMTASNGKDALEIYAREHASIALVVVDLIMPQMAGDKCLEELLKINPHVKAIVSSGHSLEPEERARLAAYARGFISKPYDVKQLLEAVEGVLNAG